MSLDVHANILQTRSQETQSTQAFQHVWGFDRSPDENNEAKGSTVLRVYKNCIDACVPYYP